MEFEGIEIGKTIKKYTAEDIPALLEKYGDPIAASDCSTLPPHHICKVYKCISGRRLVLKCNLSKGCTDPEEVRC